MDKSFWKLLEKIVQESEIVIDRPKGSSHPKYPEFIYPLDYGFIKNTVSNDGAEIDVWLGSQSNKKFDCLIATVDDIKKDLELKLLIGCTEDEKTTILNFHNASHLMKAIRINRSNESEEIK